MLHNFCKDTAPRHVRDFYLARLYRAASSADMNPYPPYDQAPEPVHDPTSRYLTLPRTRPRGDDGRFVPRADEELPVDTRERKVCGWCRTTTTSQWRVGPTHGSVEMGTLCNACGINYRRALAKSPDGTLDLDRLAQQMGHTRLSIQKALKRQRKLSAPPHQFKRSRTTARGADRFATRAAERFPINPRMPLANSHSSLTMLLSDDSLHGGHTGAMRRPVTAIEHPLDSSLYSIPPPPRTSYAPNTLTASPALSAPILASGPALSTTPVLSSTPPHVPSMPDFATSSSASLYTQSPSDRTSSRVRVDEQSPLPPFQSFIGDLQRRPPM